jgi:hypothetical protein
MPPKAHADLGASKAERWMNCPGSVAMEENLPDFESPYAAEGTAAHALAERCLNKNVRADLYVGTDIEGFEVTEEMAEAVQVFVDYVWSHVTNPADELLVEHQFDLSPLNPPGPMYGTSDATVWQPATRHLRVIDYKHGQGVAVDATENAQLMYYAIGAVLELKKEPVEITVAIVQPRGYHPEGIIREYTFTFQELVQFKRELFKAAARTQDPGAPLAVGAWCRFCKALPTCPKQRENAVSVAQTAFDVEPARQFPVVEQLSDDQLRLALDRASEVKDWLAAVAQFVAGRLERGEVFEGYKLVPKRASRKWIDEDAAQAVLEEELMLPSDELYTKKFVSPAQAEKVIKALYPAGARPSLPEGLYEAVSSGYNLAPAHDPRPAQIQPTVAEAFGAVEEEPEPPKKPARRSRKKTPKS